MNSLDGGNFFTMHMYSDYHDVHFKYFIILSIISQ